MRGACTVKFQEIESRFVKSGCALASSPARALVREAGEERSGHRDVQKPIMVKAKETLIVVISLSQRQRFWLAVFHSADCRATYAGSLRSRVAGFRDAHRSGRESSRRDRSLRLAGCSIRRPFREPGTCLRFHGSCSPPDT